MIRIIITNHNFSSPQPPSLSTSPCWQQLFTDTVLYGSVTVTLSLSLPPSLSLSPSPPSQNKWLPPGAQFLRHLLAELGLDLLLGQRAGVVRVLSARHEVEGRRALPRLLDGPPQEAELAPSPPPSPRQLHHVEVADVALET